jgi:molybdopterin synthase sulfur carrier subunit
MIVYIPMPLRSYTQVKQVEANGATLAELLIDLDRRYPGLRFRIVDEQDQLRPHIKLFVNQSVAASLADAVHANDIIQIIMAISGGYC